ncbi:MAG: hypothetical protein H6553_09015 [Chitinophagales bacterium]|nr:hypothetical protein [Chitinophagales bacterium]
MKKLMILAMVATFAFGSTACKKERTCTCTGDTYGEQAFSMGDEKKSDQEDACNTLESTYKLVDETVTCSLD